MRYSPSTGCFYPEAIKYRQLPKDLIEVTDADHRAALARPQNTQFQFSEDGKELHIIPCSPSPEEEVAQLKLQAQFLLEQSDRVVLRYYEQGTPVAPVWVEYRNQLRRVLNGQLNTIPVKPGF